MPTRTGNFPIGFRRGWSDWQKDLAALSRWAKDNGFEGLDLGRATPADMEAVGGQGLRLGSVDLLDFGKLTHADGGVRKEAVAANVAYIKETAAAGANLYFTVVLGDANRKRLENYDLAVEAYAPLAEAAAGAGANIVVEGWPGGGSMPNVCCNPETCRAFLKDTGGKGAGINYDPSHLIRMGIDHVRFLKEFAPRVFHVHAKDTEMLSEAVYELGLYQGSTFEQGHAFGEYVWRYTIPGHGMTRWTEVFKVLQSAGYGGMVSVELEDEHFNGSEAGEQAGLRHSLAFLRGA